MGRRSVVAGLSGLVLAAAMVSPTIAEAAHGTGGAPVIKRVVIDTRITPDDFFIDMCGVVTNTTWKEIDDIQTWPDGSQTVHTERSFIPDDPRLPIERDAGTSYFHSADPATQYRLDGKPIQLIGQRGGGVTALDAGLTILGDPLVHHGHLSVGPSGDLEYLRQFYCPWATP